MNQGGFQLLRKYWYNPAVKRILTISACIFAILMALFVQLPQHKVTTPEPIPTQLPLKTPQPSLKTTPISGDNLFAWVNSWRKTNGYNEYKKSEFACSIAEKRLPEIKVNWSHEGFYYGKYCTDCYLSENLSKNFFYEPDAPLILDAWVNSASHLENLKKDYTHSCIKCESGFCVHIFSYR